MTETELGLLLEELEGGKSLEDALSACGLSDLSDADLAEARDLYGIHRALHSATEGITPDPELLTRVLAKLPSGTGGGVPAEEKRSIPSRYFFAREWKVAAPIAVFLLALTVLMGGGKTEDGALPATLSMPYADTYGDAAPESVSMMMVTEDAGMRSAKFAAPAAPSGDPDDLLILLEREAENDLMLLSDAEEDALIIASDKDALSDHENIYDETF